jgi:tetratricopeptide (TPR) repeat protein
MRNTLRRWALSTLPPDVVKFIRTEALPSQRKLLKQIYEGKKSGVFKKASAHPHSAAAQIEAGDLLFKSGQMEEAITYYEKAVAIQPDLWQAHVQLEAAIRLSGAETKKDSKGNVLFNQVSYDLKRPALDKLVACCRRMVETFPESPQASFKLANAFLAQDGCFDKSVYYFHQANQLKGRQRRREGGCGLMFMATLPRCGTGYTLRSLRSGLGVESAPRFHTSTGWFPHLTLSLPSFALTDEPVPDAVIQEHIPANPENMLVLNLCIDRIIVQVRDPRQGLLSFLHYVKYLRHTNNIEGVLEARLPENYFSLSLEKQIDWQIEHYWIPHTTYWINSWIEAQKNPLFYPKIMFTTHEQLVADSKAFFETILDFYEIDRSRFKFPEKPVFEEKTHMRKGSVDEWKTVLTDKQKEKASSMIPAHFKKLFAWE